MEMSTKLSHPSPCFLLLLFLVLFSYYPSVAGTSIPALSNAVARVLNRARRIRLAKEFLYAHNVARVTSGVPPLKWNKSLARFAQNWAKQRKSDCQMIHSGGAYGENMFWYRRKKMWSPGNIVNKWFEERFYYDLRSNTCASEHMCGHYTQIVWRDTTSVGCARVKCNNRRGFLVMCVYDPRGNYEGEKPF